MSKDAIVPWSGEFAAPAMERAFRASQARQEVRQMRLIWSLALACFAAYAPLDLLAAGSAGTILLAVRAGIVGAGCLVVFALYHSAGLRHRDGLASVALVLAMSGYGTILGLRPGDGTGALLLLLVGSYLFSPAAFLPHVVTGLLGSLAAVAAATSLGEQGPSWSEFSFLLPANALAAIALSQANRSRRRLFRQGQALQAEIDSRRSAQARLAVANRRNLKLLYNTLPRPVARQLQANPGCRPARELAEVAVLFTDIVGFSQLAQRLSPERLVCLLNNLFCRFDSLVMHCGLEKIKTIGDAYLVAGGIDGRGNGVMNAAHMALLQQDEALSVGRELGLQIQLRCGLHVGPVVAGVLGRQRYAFDIWGATVNIASRLQAVAPVGGILVSAQAASCCPGGLCLGPARAYELRGCGTVRASLLQAAQE